MRRIPPAPFHTNVTPRCVRQVGRHVGVDLPLSKSSWSFQDLRSFSLSTIWVLLLQDFHFSFLLLDHLDLRIDIMAQDISPCNLLLSCRAQAVDDSTVSLLAELRCGSYGITQTGP